MPEWVVRTPRRVFRYDDQEGMLADARRGIHDAYGGAQIAVKIDARGRVTNVMDRISGRRRRWGRIRRDL